MLQNSPLKLLQDIADLNASARAPEDEVSLEERIQSSIVKLLRPYDPTLTYLILEISHLSLFNEATSAFNLSDRGSFSRFEALAAFLSGEQGVFPTAITKYASDIDSQREYFLGLANHLSTALRELPDNLKMILGLSDAWKTHYTMEAWTAKQSLWKDLIGNMVTGPGQEGDGRTALISTGSYGRLAPANTPDTLAFLHGVAVRISYLALVLFAPVSADPALLEKAVDSRLDGQLELLFKGGTQDSGHFCEGAGLAPEAARTVSAAKALIRKLSVSVAGCCAELGAEVDPSRVRALIDVYSVSFPRGTKNSGEADMVFSGRVFVSSDVKDDPSRTFSYLVHELGHAVLVIFIGLALIGSKSVRLFHESVQEALEVDKFDIKDFMRWNSVHEKYHLRLHERFAWALQGFLIELGSKETGALDSLKEIAIKYSKATLDDYSQ